MSNERQSENIENKIKKALESGEHAFDEAAWSKMEALLDKEEKKRRPILWLWLLPVLLIGVAFIIKFSGDTRSKNDISVSKRTVAEKESNIPGESKKTNTEPVGSSIGINSDENKKIVENKVSANSDKYEISREPITSPAIKAASPNETIDKQSTQNQTLVHNVLDDDKLNVKRNSRSKKKINKISAENSSDSNAGLRPTTAYNQKNDEEKPVSSSEVTELSNNENANVDSGISLPADTAGGLSVKQHEITTPELSKNEQQKNTAAADNKKPKAFTPQFYLLGSLGADAGSVKLLSFKSSTVVTKYGIGIGYQFSRNLSVQTGFYIANKKYSAGAGDYHVKPGSYWDTYKLTSVDAVCRVYDIPISIRYDLAAGRSVKYYAMAGLSSYLMKKEDYNYYYLRWGMPAEKYYTYTGNNHLFSNLNFSFGIEKKISGRFFWQLEPSISVPISGVGDGKVKLYSASLMAGIKYLPFKK